MCIENYQYLWNGTEDGWALQVIKRTSWSLTFIFDFGGPTTEQIIELRNLLPEFQGFTSSEALQALKGKSEFESKVVFGSISMQKIKRKAEALAFNFKVNATEQTSYLPTRNENQVVAIENVILANEIALNMKNAGVKIVESYVD